MAISQSKMLLLHFSMFASPSIPHVRLKTNDCYFLPPSSVLSSMKYLQDHDIVYQNLKYVALPLFSSPSEIFGSDKWPVDRLENILFCTKDPLSDIVIADFGMYAVLTCLLETSLMGVTRLGSGVSRVGLRTYAFDNA